MVLETSAAAGTALRRGRGGGDRRPRPHKIKSEKLAQRFKKQKPTKGIRKRPSEAKGGGQKPLTKGPWGGSKGGRVGKSSGGVASRLSKSGPVGKPN